MWTCYILVCLKNTTEYPSKTGEDCPENVIINNNYPKYSYIRDLYVIMLIVD